jgi:hypothetical protein
MLKKWFARKTPFLILSIVGCIVLMYEIGFDTHESNQLKSSLLFKLLFLIIAMALADTILKRFFIKNTWVWIIEILMCFGLLYYWIVS